MFRLSRDILIGFLLVCAAAWGLMGTRTLRFADQALYDAQARWLRANAPTLLTHDVVVIGIDEAAYETIPEPTALWHAHFGILLAGLSSAQPAVVGLALPLPVRSYDFLVKDIDSMLLAGIYRLRGAAPLVVGQPPGVDRKLRPIAPELLAAIGKGAIASLAICEDADGTVRRVNQRRCRSNENQEPLALAMAKHMGRQGSLTGMIDYSVGGAIEYTPVTTVLDWIRHGEDAKLLALVKGRAVIVASLLPTETRHRLPAPLAAWEPGSRTEPGAVVHIQTLRSLLGRGLIERVPANLSLLLAGVGVLLWFGRTGWLKTLLLATVIGSLVAGSTFVLWHGNYLPVANIAIVTLLAFAARYAWDFALQFRERQTLRTMFAGHVSPQVMRALLGGELQLDQNGQRRSVTLLFVGIRGFAARNAQSTPEAMIALLNRFHAAAALAIQTSGGAVDKYVGDGLMATFGLPQPLPAPQRNALEAAQDLLLRVDRLNAELAAEGIAPLKIGIGIHSGEVLAGDVGSRQRREFSVIGDAVGIASRLEAMTKEYPHPVICSGEVAAAVDFAGGMVDLGTPRADLPALWGWTPPLTAARGDGQ
ncbi:MAG: adenylate/guanylate cyclase domain-containing protein [Sulfuritalea sp.]|nr:adenylate/guanylate cyclase domain-containing protein [Sulfuritalea sp.]MDP1983339.1 adenylate/guanylate cyclase domain-containing protein [Sulfuritalea sp.]